MARKLKVELEVDSEKAKRKLRKDLDSVEGGEGGIASGADKAAKNIKNLGEAADKANYSMKNITKAFIGIGSGLAASYAAQHLEQGSTLRTGIEYGGAMLQGGSMGAMVGGPWGAVAGAALGAAKTAIDKDGEKNAYIKEFTEGETVRKNMQEWSEKLREMTKAMDVDAITALRDKLKKTADDQYERAMAAAQNGEFDKATDIRKDRDRNLSRIDYLDNLLRKSEEAGEVRASLGGADAISKIGGNFGGGDFSRESLTVQKEMSATLKSIDQKTKAGTTWQ